MLVPLLALLDVAVEDERWKPLDPVQKRLRTLDACKRLLLREAQVQPLLVVFEDLHWIDSETQALLDTPGGEPAHRPATAAGQLSPRVPASLGQPRPTTPSFASIR